MRGVLGIEDRDRRRGVDRREVPVGDVTLEQLDVALQQGPGVAVQVGGTRDVEGVQVADGVDGSLNGVALAGRGLHENAQGVLAVAALQHLAEELVLGGEVVQESGLGNVCRVGDVGQGGAGIPVLSEENHGFIEDACSLVLAARSGAPGSAPPSRGSLGRSRGTDSVHGRIMAPSSKGIARQKGPHRNNPLKCDLHVPSP